MSWKNKIKHILQYKESCVISKISKLAKLVSSRLLVRNYGNIKLANQEQKDPPNWVALDIWVLLSYISVSILLAKTCPLF